jgi:hypothetical protein
VASFYCSKIASLPIENSFYAGAQFKTQENCKQLGLRPPEQGHRKLVRTVDRRHDSPTLITRAGDLVAARSLDFYQAVGRRLANGGERP